MAVDRVWGGANVVLHETPRQFDDFLPPNKTRRLAAGSSMPDTRCRGTTEKFARSNVRRDIRGTPAFAVSSATTTTTTFALQESRRMEMSLVIPAHWWRHHCTFALKSSVFPCFALMLGARRRTCAASFAAPNAANNGNGRGHG